MKNKKWIPVIAFIAASFSASAGILNDNNPEDDGGKGKIVICKISGKDTCIIKKDLAECLHDISVIKGIPDLEWLEEEVALQNGVESVKIIKEIRGDGKNAKMKVIEITDKDTIITEEDITERFHWETENWPGKMDKKIILVEADSIFKIEKEITVQVDKEMKSGMKKRVILNRKKDLNKKSDEPGTDVGIEKNQKNKADKNKLRVYPNPNHGKFTLQYETDNSSSAEVKIFDTSGRNIHTEELSAESKFSKEIDLGECKPGSYLIQAIQNGKKYTIKCMVN